MTVKELKEVLKDMEDNTIIGITKWDGTKGCTKVHSLAISCNVEETLKAGYLLFTNQILGNITENYELAMEKRNN